MSVKTVCEKDQCCGCMACVDTCGKNAIKIVDSLKAYNAVIDESKCVNCGACFKVCQNNNAAEAVEPVKWYQGWCEDPKIRKNGSSGGAAGAVSMQFIKDGGVVCSCVFRNGKFGFEFAENTSELAKFAGSKYVKSDPSGIYKPLKKRLADGQKVLFIGLPCQVAAVKRYVGEKLAENLWTADLICHGTPSPKLLDIFLKQYNRRLSELTELKFRKNGQYHISDQDGSIITDGVTDRYLIAFINVLTLTEKCYSCEYASTKRVSDITLGDSWGTSLPSQEIKKGVSLIIASTKKGDELLDRSHIHLEFVDVAKAVEANHQLREPSRRPEGRNSFFNAVRKGEKFNCLVLKRFPKQCLKQDVKGLLTNAGVLKLIKKG